MSEPSQQIIRAFSSSHSKAADSKARCEQKAKEEMSQFDLKNFVGKLQYATKGSVIDLFCCAAKFNRPDVLQAIWEESKTIFYKDSSGRSDPLTSDLNSPDTYKATALDYAISAGHVNIVKLLHTLNKNLNFKSSTFEGTPLQNAISGGHLDIVKYLSTLEGITLNSADLDAALAAEKLNVAWFIICKKIKYNTKQLCELMSLASKQNQVGVLKSIITQLIEKSSSPIAWDKEVTSNGKTILGTAVHYNQREAVQLLLENGKANLNFPDREGMSPLHHAAMQGNIEIARDLCEHGALIDFDSYQGKTPLMLAVENNDIEMVQLLVSLKADANKQNKGKAEVQTSLSIALRNHSFNIAYYLFKKGVEANKDECISLFCLAIKNNHTLAIEVFKKIIGDTINMPCAFTGYTPLMCAAGVGNIGLIQYLLERKADPNYKPSFRIEDFFPSRTVGDFSEVIKTFHNLTWDNEKTLNNMIVASSGALHECALYGHERAAELLIKAGAKVEETNQMDITSLEVAAARNKVGMVKLLLDQGAEMERKSSFEYSAVFLASIYKNTEVLKVFLARRPHIKLKSVMAIALSNFAMDVVGLFFQHGAKLTLQEHVDVLCLAAQNNRPSIIKAILEAPQVHNLINQLSSKGWNALTLATREGHRNIVQLLIKHKADVNQLNKDGSAPLHMAVTAGVYDIARDLITAGATVDPELSNGETPLCIAAKNGLQNMLILLLTNKAKINHQAEGGRTPLFLAVENNQLRIVQTLLKRKADPTIQGYYKLYKERAPSFLVAVFNKNAPIAQALVQAGSVGSDPARCFIKGLSLLNELAPRFKAIPNNIYFIWVGGCIPKLEYYVTLIQLAALARKSNFTVHLIMDNVYDFHRGATQFDVNIPNLKVWPVSKMIKKMQTDPFYRKNVSENVTRFKQFLSIIIPEAVGFKNLAALADFIRVEALRQKGGHYFDIDTQFITSPNELLYPQYAAEGILMHQRIVKMQVRDKKGELVDVAARPMSNDIISGMPDHEGFSDSLLKMVKKYNKLNARWKEKPFQRTLQDKKRFLIIPPDNLTFKLHTEKQGTSFYFIEGEEGRRSLTIETSSAPVQEGILEYFRKVCPRVNGKALFDGADLGEPVCYTSVDDPVKINPTQFHDTGISVSGILARHKADQNWLKRSEEPQYAFDDSELYSPAIRSLFGRRK